MMRGSKRTRLFSLAKYPSKPCLQIRAGTYSYQAVGGSARLHRLNFDFNPAFLDDLKNRILEKYLRIRSIDCIVEDDSYISI